MNRQNLIILIVAAVIVIAGLVYFLGLKGGETEAPATPAATSPAPATPGQSN